MATNDEKLITLSNLEEFKNNLADVAISNDYDDLDNKPVMEYENATGNTNRIKKDLSLRKTYTGVLGVANGDAAADKNTYANTSFYFLNVVPKTWYSEWTVKYHLNIHLDDETQVYKQSNATTHQVGQLERGLYDCMISGTSGTNSTFHFFQSQKNTTYRPIYYHMTHSTTKAGYDNYNLPFKIGVSLASSYLPTPTSNYPNATSSASGSAVTTKYSRTIEVVVDEAINCEVSLNDVLEIEADAYVTSTNGMGEYTKLNSTYYTTNTSASNSAGRWNNLSATTQGLYESGDDNTYTYTQQSSNYLVNGTTYSDNSAGYLLGYSMIGFDKDGKALMISKKSPTTTSYNTGIDQTRVYCNAGFDYTKGIRYVSTSSNFAANTNMNVSTQINYSGLDFRYNDNCVASGSANTLGLVNREPVYLRGTIGDDGLFYLDPIEVTYSNKTYKRVWVQPGDATRLATSPFDTNHVYWFVGYPYYNSSYPNSLYQLNLITQGELNKWNGTKLVPYTGIEGITSIDWSDVQNKPTIPAAQVNSDWNASSGVAQILNKPTLATVATSGSYNDLNNKLVTNSTYNATTNKIATMEDVSNFAIILDFNDFTEIDDEYGYILYRYDTTNGQSYTSIRNSVLTDNRPIKIINFHNLDMPDTPEWISDLSDLILYKNNHNEYHDSTEEDSDIKYSTSTTMAGFYGVMIQFSVSNGSVFLGYTFLPLNLEVNGNLINTIDSRVNTSIYGPTSMGDEGQILTWNSSHDVISEDPSDVVERGLPSYTQSTDLGKTLTITSDGIDWEAPLSAAIDTTNKTITVGSNSVSYGTTGNNKLLQLNSSGKIDSSVLPPVAITDTSVVNSQAAMLALTAQIGDICVRTDLNKSYILKEDGASTLSHWQELLTPTDTVTSVAGKTGAVTLGASDVGITVTSSSVSDGTNTFTKYSHPTTTATNAGLYKVGKDSLGHVVLGDAFTIPTNSWRPIKVDGTDKLTDTSTALNFLNTGNVQFTYASGLKASIDLSQYQPLDADLTAIAGLTGASGILKKTAANTWALDTNTYVTSSGVTSVATSGTGLSGGTITTTGTITLDSSSAGNAAANKVVLRNAAGSIQTEKVAISSGTTTKATMQYDTTNDCIKFVFS